MNKNEFKPVPLAVKGVIVAFIYQVGCFVVFDEILFSLAESIRDKLLITIGLLICGLIIRNNFWRQTLFTWMISVTSYSIILIPVISYEFKDMFSDLVFAFGFSPFLIFVLLYHVLIYGIYTFISTLVVMLVYKFIQKKRTAKHLHDTDNSHDDREA